MIVFKGLRKGSREDTRNSYLMHATHYGMMSQGKQDDRRHWYCVIGKAIKRKLSNNILRLRCNHPPTMCPGVVTAPDEPPDHALTQTLNPAGLNSAVASHGVQQSCSSIHPQLALSITPVTNPGARKRGCLASKYCRQHDVAVDHRNKGTERCRK